MTGITDRLPTPLSERLASASQSIYSRQGREVDIAIGGIPFRLATSRDFPQSVKTIPVRKDQFDSEADPGEQSLTGWWRRSQSSWHEGAGSLYQESNDSNKANVSFYDSRGVDVFTQGQFKLIKKMNVSTRGASTLSNISVYAGGVSAIGSNGSLWTAPDPSGTFTDAIGFTNLSCGFISNTTFYVGKSFGGYVYVGDLSAPGAARSYPGTNGISRIMWGKGRLWIMRYGSICTVDTTAATGTPQSLVYGNPDVGWGFTCMAEGPSAMYFAGHNSITSSIMAITLDASGGIPTLSAAANTAIFPNGEQVQELAVLAGQYIGIGTNRGFRVGLINSTSGAITYGPLIIEPAGVTACTALTTQGKFFVVAFQTSTNESIAYRVDTSTPLDGGVFPYAADIDLGIVGNINSLAAVSSSRLVATGSTGEAYNQSTTDYVSTGYLQTGRIRYHMTEPKLFKYVNVEIAPLQGAIQVDLINDGNTTLPVGNITKQNDIFVDRFLINAVTTLRYASLKFTLTPKTGTPDATPIIYSYLLKALPAVAPQRLITVPLLCFDRETSISGQQYGALGYANDRVTALQLLESLGDTLVYQDFTTSNSTGQIVTIESVEYVQTSPPAADRSGNGGGIVILQLRTADT